MLSAASGSSPPVACTDFAAYVLTSAPIFSAPPKEARPWFGVIGPDEADLGAAPLLPESCASSRRCKQVLLHSSCCWGRCSSTRRSASTIFNGIAVLVVSYLYAA